ncbi:4152_t:CDS:2 [Entrophospora sp. SA101]|nr:5480_t:CDS:2 [Entrophospora sp. SA101]CAJ0636120.1 11130_t:CDS:2 [Entrophospora sp. SA101]CAJ0747676.1 4152_t:CDS:2 [Entrophospora sp. SA101]CAJ0832598.1 2953_t:CDS:2 [Entrophospora sp. SA101]CAJ0838242.1 5591_t:CDS:2 [Entrophospora sp. SA101]
MFRFCNNKISIIKEFSSSIPIIFIKNDTISRSTKLNRKFITNNTNNKDLIFTNNKNQLKSSSQLFNNSKFLNKKFFFFLPSGYPYDEILDVHEILETYSDKALDDPQQKHYHLNSNKPIKGDSPNQKYHGSLADLNINRSPGNLESSDAKNNPRGSPGGISGGGMRIRHDRRNFRVFIDTLFTPRVKDAVFSTILGLTVIFLGGVLYQSWYEWHEGRKVLKAFTDSLPSLRPKMNYLEKDEYKSLFHAIAGDTKGIYYLLVGENGTGKSQIVFQAMDRCNQFGIVFCEAHSNPEIFKVRLGRSLNYTYREDYIGGLFAREAPERGSALLDIEKALNVVEEAAYKYKGKYDKPLVLIINNIHSLKDDEDGEDMLELLQQRAESWASSGVVTMIFNTDDHWVYERMRTDDSHMEVIKVHDLNKDEAIEFLKDKRNGREPEEVLEKIVDECVGGRLLYLNKLAKADDVDLFEAANRLKEEQKTWLINLIGLIPNFDGLEIESQRYAVAAWKLIRELVRSPTKTISIIEGRSIIGNSRYLKKLDHDGIIMIDQDNQIKPDSQISYDIFEEMIQSPDFNKILKKVDQRLMKADKIIWDNGNKWWKFW